MSIIYEKDDRIAYITINRPEQKNSLDPETVVKLFETWKDYENDENLRAAIITGAGNDAFCSGGDLALLIPLLTGKRKPETDADFKIVNDPMIIMKVIFKGYELYKPIVAAVNGFCIAGGMEMLQALDIRVASENAVFSIQEVKWGLFPGAGSTVRLPRQIPYCKAMEILLTGGKIDAQEAYRIGLINRVVPEEKLMDTAREYAETLADNGPLAVRTIKESIITNLGRPLEEAFTRETELAARVLMSKDAREGPIAFKEKRKPNFTGR